MAPAPAPQTQHQQSMSPDVERVMSNSELLDVILNTSEPTVKQKQMTQWFDGNTESIEVLLPEFMKGQGQRLTRRAMMTMASRPELQDVPVREFIRCVLEAAEFGFAIDGKLVYILKYGGKSACYSVQFDYKALIAVAKRTGMIHSCDYDVVCENDHFVHSRQNGTSVLEHTYSLAVPRGNTIGAYCRVWHRDGTWSYEVMNKQELDKVQAVSPAQNGPWKMWPDEMRKKTVIKRLLKRYREDPAMSRMIDMDDIEFDRTPDAAMETPSLDAVIDRTQSRVQQLASQSKRTQRDEPKQEEPKQEERQPQQQREERVESQDSNEPVDKSANGDGELTNFQQAEEEINAAPHPLACTTAYEKWKGEFTDGDAADLKGIYEKKLASYPTSKSEKPKKGNGQLPLQG